MIRVMLADDHAMFLQSVGLMLDGVEDIELVATAKSGEEAVKLADKLKPDVALLDVQMTGMGGLGAAIRLREKQPGCAVIGLTGYDDMVYPDLFVQAGAMGWIYKTAPFDQMVDAIRSVSNGQTWIDPRANRRLSSGKNGTENPIKDLSERERQVFRLRAQGLNDERIAGHLELSLRTVRDYRQRIYSKLNIENDIELLRLAYRFRVIED